VFLPIVTHVNLLGKRITADEAAQIVDEWLDQRNPEISCHRATSMGTYSGEF
jgi:hypothetical protein